jgi:hypothetical protein
MLIAYIHWFEKNNLFSAGFVCCLFLQLITDGGAVSVHNMQTTRRSMFNRLLGNVKLVRYYSYYQMITIFLTVRYKRRPL